MADDFMVFLVGGLMILAVLLAVFNGSVYSQYQPQEMHYASCYPNCEYSVINYSTANPVGPKDYTSMQVFSFAFDASNMQESREIDLGGATVKNGVLFGENDLKYRLLMKNPIGLQISFSVVKANELEPLIIQVNGMTVFSKILQPGEYRVDVDNSLLAEDNLITFYPQSSGWQIWAPNLYELSNVKLFAEGYVNTGSTYLFNIDMEYDNFKYGKIDLSLAENVGSLNAIMNYNTIYSAPPSSGVSFQFSKYDLLRGENIVNIEANSDSSFKGIGVITIYYDQQKISEFRTPLNLTKYDIGGMNRTVIRFNTANVAAPGGLEITMANSGSITYREFATVGGSSAYEFVLDRMEVAEGYNVITIESLEGARFDVTDFSVSFR